MILEHYSAWCWLGNTDHFQALWKKKKVLCFAWKRIFTYFLPVYSSYGHMASTLLQTQKAITVFFIYIFLCGVVIYVDIHICGFVRLWGWGSELGALIYLSLSYFFETGPINEPGARLAAIKSNYFFRLHSCIILELQACTTMPFYMGAWDLNSVTYACATWNLNHWTICSGSWPWSWTLCLQAVTISSGGFITSNYPVWG